MLLTEDDNPGLYKIKSYSPGKLFINEEVVTNSVLITTKILDAWLPRNLSELVDTDWDFIVNYAPEILIIGVGAQFIFPNAKQLAPLYQHQISFEMMDTLAACRTISILMAEHRDVMGALLID